MDGAEFAGSQRYSGCKVVTGPRCTCPHQHLCSDRGERRKKHFHGAVGSITSISAKGEKAAAGYDRPSIAYRRSPTRLDYYAASEWADEPARLIEPLIIATAEASGGFEAVVSTGTGLTTELRLDTEIVRIEHELQSAPSRGRLTLRAQLVDVVRGRVIGTQIFDASVPSRSDDAEGAVAAIDTALTRVLEQVVAFCLNTTAARPTASPKPPRPATK